MHYFVTGGAGFVGSNMVGRLLQNEDAEVTVYDNFSTGCQIFLENVKTKPNFRLIKGDLLDFEYLKTAMRGSDFVFHFAANADVRSGTKHPRKDLEQNTIATHNVLESMRYNGVKKILFPSTGSIYGDAKVLPTPEDSFFPIQTSLYGASKLACEGLISAYCEGFGLQSYIFRLVSILGEHYTHGHVIDFYKKLLNNPHELNILGDGSQKKSYLYVHDCIDAMFLAINKAEEKINIFNLGTDEYCEVNHSVSWITENLKLNPKLKYSGGERGWVGDSPFIYLDTKKIRSFGWRPKFSIKDSCVRTLDYLKENRWVLELR